MPAGVDALELDAIARRHAVRLPPPMRDLYARIAAAIASTTSTFIRFARSRRWRRAPHRASSRDAVRSRRLPRQLAIQRDPARAAHGTVFTHLYAADAVVVRDVESFLRNGSRIFAS
jgi:hypothetical protein